MKKQKKKKLPPSVEPRTDQPSSGSPGNFTYSEILGDFLKGLLFIALVLAVKIAFEHTRLGRQLELAGYAYLQQHLVADDVPVQIVDISDLEVAEIHRNGRVYKATPRNTLQELIQAIAEQQPRAIGLDIDFSPDSNGYLMPDDEQFFQFCLDQAVPIFLGIRRTHVLPPEAWLNDQRYEGLAASIILPKDDTRKIPSSIQTSPQFKAGRTMGAALGNAYGESQCRVGELLQARGFAERQSNRELGVGGGIVEFAVDYSPLDELMNNKTLRTTNPDVIRAQRGHFYDKIVLLGRATIGIAPDTFPVANKSQPIPGVYVHAAAAYTVAKAPLYELTAKSRLVIDAIMSGGILLVVIAVRLRLRKSTFKLSVRKLQTLLTVLVVGVAMIVGVILVRVTCVLWSDFVMALGAVALHPSIEHHLSNLWRFIKRTIPKFLRDLISESDEEVRK